ncbi:hypothetical protein HanIR_Chr02g0063621 [Helianthus annuus]|nr:hypothetical protein HanIR_Chr02g0063621 [Helianthus annuus]KAJ0618134.1 hypothetical protein HanHA89_Chr02g0049761 [Helianthus annuus]
MLKVPWLVVHPVSGEVLEEGEFVAELSNEQMLALNEMKAIDDASIDNIPSEPETEDIENIDEIVFEGETRKSTYVREDGIEFNPFDEDWLKDHLEAIDEKLKNHDSTDDATDSFKEWRKLFLSKVAKPTPSGTQVDYLKFDKEKPR